MVKLFFSFVKKNAFLFVRFLRRHAPIKTDIINIFNAFMRESIGDNPDYMS